MIRFYRLDSAHGIRRAPARERQGSTNALYELIHQTDCFDPRGLSHADALRRREIYGLNRPEPGGHPGRQFARHTLRRPFFVCLLGLATAFAAAGFPRDALCLVGVLLFDLVVRVAKWQQESARVARAVPADRRVTTLRDGLKQAVPSEQLVPGDIVFLGAGDPVPADIRLIRANELWIEASVLTGEETAVPKKATPDSTPIESVFDLPQICLFGSQIVHGSAQAVVLRTGTQTHLAINGARSAARLTAASAPELEALPIAEPEPGPWAAIGTSLLRL
jgi:Mg2+-importing ATPase